jgi:heavy metal-binding protein
MRKLFALLVVVFACTVVWAQQSDTTAWFCPMHPDVTQAAPGRCPKCAMALVLGDPFDTRDYPLEFTASPAAIRAGEPVRMTFLVRHPQTALPVTAFETVHDKQFHLFVVSQDMEVFQHIHPVLEPGGAWTIDVTLPKPGYYRLLSDFLPTGGAPQFLARTIVTAGFAGDDRSQLPALTPDAAAVKTVDSMTASLELNPAVLVEGQYGHLTLGLKDSATGQPVEDLEPYLGAFGHMLILNEPMTDYVHSHPTPRPENEVSRGTGGPSVEFEGYLPRAGLYRSWAQFQRRGRVVTIPFTVKVWSLEEAARGQ